MCNQSNCHLIVLFGYSFWVRRLGNRWWFIESLTSTDEFIVWNGLPRTEPMVKSFEKSPFPKHIVQVKWCNHFFDVESQLFSMESDWMAFNRMAERWWPKLKTYDCYNNNNSINREVKATTINRRSTKTHHDANTLIPNRSIVDWNLCNVQSIGKWSQPFE